MLPLQWSAWDDSILTVCFNLLHVDPREPRICTIIHEAYASCVARRWKWHLLTRHFLERIINLHSHWGKCRLIASSWAILRHPVVKVTQHPVTSIRGLRRRFRIKHYVQRHRGIFRSDGLPIIKQFIWKTLALYLVEQFVKYGRQSYKRNFDRLRTYTVQPLSGCLHWLLSTLLLVNIASR